MSAAVQSKLKTVPVTLAVANEFVDLNHRHHPKVVGHKSSIGVVDELGARVDKHPTGPKIRWECQCSTAPTMSLEAA